MPPAAELVADKGYDSKPLRDWLAERGTTAVIQIGPMPGIVISRLLYILGAQQRCVVAMEACARPTTGAGRF